MAGHRHQNNIEIAATALRKEGHISALTTIYNGRCECGEPKRNTRLAGTIWVLRHDYGWDIETEQKAGMLADYVLLMAGTPTKQEKARARLVVTRPTGNSKPATIADDVPKAVVFYCPHCTLEVAALTDQRLLGGYRIGRCSNCNLEVKAMPWKPESGVKNKNPRMNIGRSAQGKRTYRNG